VSTEPRGSTDDAPSRVAVQGGGEGDEGIVDAHQHFWDLRNYYPWLCDPEPIDFRYGDYGAIRKTYLPPDYLRDCGKTRVAMTVHMEAEWDPRDPLGETLWLEQIAATYTLPTACVAQAWLDRDDIESVLEAQAARPMVRGIRHKPRAAKAPDCARRGEPGSMDDPRWRRGFALLSRHALSFDLQTPWWHLDAAADLARDFPDTAIIVNHTGLPGDRSPAGLAGWRVGMQQVARYENVFLKISGLGQRGQAWTIEANGPIIRDAIAMFGIDRCMFASNYPVDKLCARFETIFAGFRAAVSHLGPAGRRKLFRDNAMRVYRLAGS
jgi:predicted TIM-barrel fold metal-dependent hydrolase